MRDSVLKAFYHTSRRMFPWWTAAEICKRAKMLEPNVFRQLQTLREEGLAACEGTDGKPKSWKLTKSGEAEASAIFAAEEVAKGGIA